MSTTTSTKRRSARIKKKQEEEEEIDEQMSENENENESEMNESEMNEDDNRSDISQQSDYKNKLRKNGQVKDLSQEQDMVQIEGDPNHKYSDGDCVWAKFEDFPWWPGQIEINKTNSRRRKNKKKKTIKVRWFGEYDDETVQCDLINVIPWDPDDADRICVEVEEEDLQSFQDSMDNANTTHLHLCEERAVTPNQSALDYEEKNALRQKEALNTTNKKSKKKNVTKNTRKSKRKPKKKVSKTKTTNATSEAPELEPIDDDSKNDKDDKDDNEDENEIVNERKSSLRSAKNKKPRPEKSATDTKVSSTVNQKKSVRRRGRKSSISSQSDDDKDDKDKKDNIKTPPKNKRGRKRKYDEAMNGDTKEVNDENDDSGNDKDENEDIDVEDKDEPQKRRSVRIKKKKGEMESEEDKEQENDDDVDEDDIGNLKRCANSAFEMCDSNHSDEDYMPFVALVYYGMKAYNKIGDKESDITKTVGKLFHLNEEQVLHHLSQFTEKDAKKKKYTEKHINTNPKKKRKTN